MTGSALAAENSVRPVVASMFKALGQTQDLPSDFEGIWDTTVTIRDCATNTVLNTTTETDTICAAEAFDPEDDDDFGYECVTSVTSNSVEVDCSAGFTAFEGCEATLVYDFTTTFSSGSYVGNGTLNTTYTGATCGPLTNSCVKFEITGTRTASGAGVCSSPVEPVSWGRIKARHQ